MMQLIYFKSCNSISALLLLIACSASSAFTPPVYSSPDNRPPPPHQLQYTRPLPYHRLVEQESRPPDAAQEADAVPHAIESRAYSVPPLGAYHPPDGRPHYAAAAPPQTQLHLLPPQPLPSSLYPRNRPDEGEYRAEYNHPDRPEEGEHHPSQESHPLDPVYESSHVPALPHESGPQHPHENYHLRLKYDHEPASHHSASDHLQPHASSHAHGEDVPAQTELYHSQDTYGNYGFGYQTQTIKGDGNYRYEKREGSETSGGYGFKTDGGKVEAHFHTHPHHAAEHQPHFDHRQHHASHHADHRESSPPDYHADLPPLTDNHLHESAAERSPIVYNGPHYDSVYDVDTPHVLYAHAADELGNEEAPNSIAGRAAAASDLSGSDERADRDVERLAYASSSPSEPIMTETMNALKSSPFLSHYLSTLDSLMPSGFTSRVVQVYKDRKKKKK